MERTEMTLRKPMLALAMAALLPMPALSQELDEARVKAVRAALDG